MTRSHGICFIIVDIVPGMLHHIPSKIAQEILGGIAKFVKSQKPVHMKLICIVVHQGHMLDPFRDEMNKRIDGNQKFLKKIAEGKCNPTQ